MHRPIWVAWPLEHNLGDVFESHLLHPLLVPKHVVPSHACRGERVVNFFLIKGKGGSIDTATLRGLEIQVLPATSEVSACMVGRNLGRCMRKGDNGCLSGHSQK